jgi:hypothetical protein
VTPYAERFPLDNQLPDPHLGVLDCQIERDELFAEESPIRATRIDCLCQSVRLVAQRFHLGEGDLHTFAGSAQGAGHLPEHFPLEWRELLLRANRLAEIAQARHSRPKSRSANADGKALTTSERVDARHVGSRSVDEIQLLIGADGDTGQRSRWKARVEAAHQLAL